MFPAHILPGTLCMCVCVREINDTCLIFFPSCRYVPHLTSISLSWLGHPTFARAHQHEWHQEAADALQRPLWGRPHHSRAHFYYIFHHLWDFGANIYILTCGSLPLVFVTFRHAAQLIPGYTHTHCCLLPDCGSSSASLSPLQFDTMKLLFISLKITHLPQRALQSAQHKTASILREKEATLTCD